MGREVLVRGSIFVWLLSIAYAGAQQTPAFLLPDDVHPLRHTVELTLDPRRDSFSGLVRIDAELKKTRDLIWLNGKDLTVEEALIEGKDGSLPAIAAEVNGEFISLKLPHPIGPGTVTIRIRYRAPLSATATAGVYRRRVKDDWYAFTVFTPIEARRAFPCFDEPRFKTPWIISIRTKTADKAFSNAPALSRQPDSAAMQITRFAATQALSAEVVAFAVGPFDTFDAGWAGGKHTPVRVITAREEARNGKEAGLATQAVLPRLEAYTGIPYPWSKLDHLALPASAYGAVENPGLITYRSAALLVEADKPDAAKARAVRAIEAHELAHQWFGDLVTQASWRDVWLSEGFATWLSGKVMDEEEAAARKGVRAVLARERIMQAEAKTDTPVRRSIDSRSDIESVYNPMVYQKGASILRMSEEWLGRDAFQRSLRLYLSQHAFGNATTDDLLAAIRNTTKVDPWPILLPFLDRSGVPHISGSVECRPRENKVTISSNSQGWPIPVCWLSNGKARTCTVVDHSQTVTPGACPQWIYLNADGAGYYRTEWNARQLAALKAEALSNLNTAERLTLAFDVWSSLEAKKLTPDEAHDVLSALAADQEPEVARAAAQALGREHGDIRH